MRTRPGLKPRRLDSRRSHPQPARPRRRSGPRPARPAGSGRSPGRVRPGGHSPTPPLRRRQIPPAAPFEHFLAPNAGCSGDEHAFEFGDPGRAAPPARFIASYWSCLRDVHLLLLGERRGPPCSVRRKMSRDAIAPRFQKRRTSLRLEPGWRFAPPGQGKAGHLRRPWRR